jgi:hypothetical protein
VSPQWLSRKGAANDDVRTLVSLLQGDQPQAKEPPMPPPTPMPPAPPESDRPPPQQHARQHPQAQPPIQDQLPPQQPLEISDDIGRLPAPPRIGSLLPGGRSNPPPANDMSDALAEHISAFASAAIELAIARSATLAVLEGQLLDLSIEVAEALIEREVEADPKLHGALARAALQSLGDATHVTLRTSPDGFEAVCAALGGPEVEVRGVRVQIVPDETIPGLGCVVDGDSVRVDATVSERLRAVRRAFEEERRRAAENVE